jgi:CubicO group peptidase (beta-lactamase class C family)
MKNCTIPTLAISIVLCGPLALAQRAPDTCPENVGMSSERLARIDTFVERHLDARHFAGAVTLVARRGEIVHFEAHGMQDIQKNITMSKGSIFRIYSMTKPITSVAVMMLFEEGHFLLDEPVSRFLPEFENLKVGVEMTDPATGKKELIIEPAVRQVTIRDLLRHTSGLTYGLWGSSLVDAMYLNRGVLSRDESIQHMINKLGAIPLKHQPGSTWEYSVSTDVLGRLIEVVSGQPLDEYLEEKVFTPLQMVDTDFYVRTEEAHLLTSVYTPNEDNTAISLLTSGEAQKYLDKPTFIAGGSGLVSTARDYYRFAQMLLNGGELDGVRILGPETVELMTRNHVADIALRGDLDWYGTGLGFGLGFWIGPDRGVSGLAVSEGSFGWGGMAQTTFWVDPREELVGIFLIQILPESPLPYRELFKTVVYQAIVD